MGKNTPSQTMFAAYERSLINGRNLSLAAERHRVAKAEEGLAAVKADKNHTYTQLSDARCRLRIAKQELETVACPKCKGGGVCSAGEQEYTCRVCNGHGRLPR